MMEYFIYNGISSADLGLYVGGKESFNAPARNIKKISVPGRNGDIVIDQGSYKNISVSYTILAMSNFKSKVAQIKDWLVRPTGYCRLEDSYSPDHFRLGMVTEGIDFILYKLNTIGKAVITFDCKPQKFLKSGEIVTTFDANGYINNPTNFEAKPLVQVMGFTGVGTWSVNNVTFTITYGGLLDYLWFDFETQNVYRTKSQNRNQFVSINSDTFPTLIPGSNEISFGGSITSLKITPRWWTL